MKFELNEYHRNISDEELLADVKRVANSLNVNSMTQKDYKKQGKYGLNTFRRHFGSWNKVLELCGMQANVYQLSAALGEHEHHLVDTCELLDDIKRVAELLNKESISSREYSDYGIYSSGTCFNRFSTWNEALKQAGLKPYKQISEKRIDDKVLLKEIERIWIKLGRQPTTSDIKAGISKYSLHAYAEHFGGWRGALQAFMQYIEETNDVEPLDEGMPVDVKDIKAEAVTCKETERPRHKTSRDVNDGLRYKVFRRDNFRCCICGNSPAKDSAIELHADHIIPWSKGGETVMENLQTLCSKCNLGKSDLDM